jgi:hypothetical protein
MVRGPRPGVTQLEKRLEQLADLDMSGVRWAWRDAFGRDAPDGLAKDLLIRLIAYQLQVRVFGGLDRKTKHALERLGRGDRSILETPRAGSDLKPGTILVREFNGETHHVTVLEKGYAWRGKTYPTLSAAARAITGTHWNGYVFFGLKAKAKRAKADG